MMSAKEEALLQIKNPDPCQRSVLDPDPSKDFTDPHPI